MKKMVSLILVFVMVVFSGCVQYNDSDGIYSDGGDDNKQNIEQEKQNIVIEVGEKIITARNGNEKTGVFTDIRSKAVVASDGNWYIVCIAYDCTSRPFGTPTEVFVTIKVENFTYDVDGNMIANYTHVRDPIVAFSEGYNLAGYYYRCAQYDTIRAAAWKGGWMNFEGDDVIISGIEIITNGNESFEGGGSAGK